MSQMTFDDGERPKYNNEELTDDDLLIIYAFCRFDYYGRQLDDFEKRSIFRKLMFKDTADLPDVANTFKDLNHPVTQKVAQVAEETEDDGEELRRRVTMMYQEFLALALPPAEEAAYAAALAQTPFTIPKHPFDPKKQYTRDKPKPISKPSANIREMIEFYWRHHTIGEAYATAQYQAWLAGKDPLPNPQQGTSSSG